VATLPEEIVAEAQVLFRDTRLDAIDPDEHASFVIARVLDLGTMSSVSALVRTYGLERLRSFFRGGGLQRVSVRTGRLWQAYLGLEEGECTPRSSLRIRSPFWKA
jgi:hypothetical protein